RPQSGGETTQHILHPALYVKVQCVTQPHPSLPCVSYSCELDLSLTSTLVNSSRIVAVCEQLVVGTRVRAAAAAAAVTQ
ncbi:hypothetical protein JOB18_043748, partial [Solea senegalensis]